MKVLTPGHKYIAANFERPKDGQTIQFIEKYEEYTKARGEIEKPTGKMVTLCDGTTTEEVIRVLIDRLTFLQQLCSCKENACAITHLQEAENWLERRTRDREKRQVEGKNLA